jgi:putative ABC transport system ATP-binding protein
MSISPVIELSGIRKSFLTETVETRALDNLSLRITKGEFVALSGPSGSGKSTLLSLMGLLDVWNEGRYLLNGRDVSQLDRDQRAAIRCREIGFVFQAFHLISDMTVAENVALPLTYRNDLDKNQRAKMVAEALERVDMTPRANHFPSQLSGGQQQRVAVARAVAGRPSLILADEPTGNLDSKNADAVIELLETLHRDGTTLCMVTHNPETAARCPRQIALFDGRIASDHARPTALREAV